LDLPLQAINSDGFSLKIGLNLLSGDNYRLVVRLTGSPSVLCNSVRRFRRREPRMKKPQRQRVLMGPSSVMNRPGRGDGRKQYKLG
jgi:hypothetical protein